MKIISSKYAILLIPMLLSVFTSCKDKEEDDQGLLLAALAYLNSEESCSYNGVSIRKLTASTGTRSVKMEKDVAETNYWVAVEATVDAGGSVAVIPDTEVSTDATALASYEGGCPINSSSASASPGISPGITTGSMIYTFTNAGTYTVVFSNSSQITLSVQIQ